MEKITQIKLQEIEKKRKRILQRYDEIEKDILKIKTLDGKLEKLSQSLLPIEKGLDINSIETILNQAKLGTVSNDVLQLHFNFLFKKIDYGRTKSEFAYIFGSVLKEYFSTNKKKFEDIANESENIEEVEEFEDKEEKESEERKKAMEVAKSLLEPVPKNSFNSKFLDDLFQELLSKVPAIKSSIKNYEESIKSRVSIEEIQAAIKALCLDNLISNNVKRYLSKIESNSVICNEFAGAVTIAIENIEEWNWPEKNKFLLIKNLTEKWRMFIQEDVFDAILLQVIGTRWGYTLKKELKQYVTKGHSTYYYRIAARKEIANKTILCTLPDSLVDSTPTGNYDRATSRPSTKDNIIHYISSETAAARSKLKRAVNIVSTDIENFYGSISQEMIIHLLKTFGFSQKWIDFFIKFMTPTIIIENGNEKIQGKIKRGLLSGHSISKCLHEMLMFLGDIHCGHKEDKYLIRDFDDIFYISSSEVESKVFMKKMEEFVSNTGLKLSKEKTGQFDLNGKNRTVSKNNISFGVLILNEQGHWIPDSKKIEKMNQSLEKRLKRCQTIIEWIKIYNSHIRQLEKLLSSPSKSMGIIHLKSLCDIFSNLHLKVGEGKGVIKYLEDEINSRFKERNSKLKIPEAWYYWPLTAGGLGIYHPLIILSAHSLTIKEDQESLFAHLSQISNEETDDNWSSTNSKSIEQVLISLSNIVEATSPQSSTVMDGRTRDFIKRGSDLRGVNQNSLGVYWKWLLANYSDQILETVGTLEFTDTELVPIALIQSKSS